MRPRPRGPGRTSRRPLVAVALAACAGVVLVSAQPPGPSTPPAVVLRNATLIDGTGAPPRANVTIVLERGRIASISAGAEQAPEGAAVHDLTGRTVIPGLIDSHLHLMHRFRISRASAYAELARMLHGGVVIAREMAGDTRLTSEAARAILIGQATGPELYFSALMAGPHFFTDDPRPGPAAQGFTAGQVPWAQAVTPDSDLPLVVARAAGTLATGLKLYMQLDGDLMRRLTEEAHRQGLKVWSHATVYPNRPMEAVRAGIDGVSHACGLAWQSAALDPSRFARPSMKNRPRFDPSLVRADSPEMTALFTEMTRRGTLFEPTLAVHFGAGDDQFGCTEELVTSLTRAAHRAGVSILAGTDFVAKDDDPYPSLHQEIERLVESGGLTPLEAITAATRNGARALGLEATHGTIEPGKIANLVILESDPSRDIRALRTVETVIQRGRPHLRASYQHGSMR